MKDSFFVGQLVKFKRDRLHINRYKNPNRKITLPSAGMILDISTEDWVHPYYGLSKHFEQKESKIEVATVNWFEYKIPEIGESDLFNLNMYNQYYKKVPLTRLSDFNKYVEGLKKKKDLYK